jgi:hypothetical protein
VEVDAPTTTQARSLLTAHGFAVTRVTQPRTTPSSTTSPTPFVRASAVLDMPPALDKYERRAYVRGYAAGCMTFVKKHGIPRGENLVKATKAAEWERHPAAHRKGLAELAAYRERWGR